MDNSQGSTIIVAIIGFISTLLSAIIGAYATIKAAELSFRAKTNPPVGANQHLDNDQLPVTPSSPGKPSGQKKSEPTKNRLVRRTIIILTTIVLSLSCCFISLFLFWYNADAIYHWLGLY